MHLPQSVSQSVGWSHFQISTLSVCLDRYSAFVDNGMFVGGRKVKEFGHKKRSNNYFLTMVQFCKKIGGGIKKLVGGRGNRNIWAQRIKWFN